MSGPQPGGTAPEKPLMVGTPVASPAQRASMWSIQVAGPWAWGLWKNATGVPASLTTDAMFSTRTRATCLVKVVVDVPCSSKQKSPSKTAYFQLARLPIRSQNTAKPAASGTRRSRATRATTRIAAAPGTNL